jgi:hypothetical protein
VWLRLLYLIFLQLLNLWGVRSRPASVTWVSSVLGYRGMIVGRVVASALADLSAAAGDCQVDGLGCPVAWG